MLEFHLGPEICDRLAGIATVRLRVKEPDIGVVGTTVIAWPAMLTSGAADPSSRLNDDTVRLRRAAQAAPVPEPEPEPEPVAEPPRAPFVAPPPASRAAGLARTGAATALERPGLADRRPRARGSGGGGYYAYTTYFQKPEPQVAAATPPAAPVATPTPLPAGAAHRSVRDIVGEYLATKPTPEAMLAKARDYAKAGEMPAAFWCPPRRRDRQRAGPARARLLLRSAGDHPPRPASRPTARVPWTGTNAPPLPARPRAQRKLGLLLVKGGGGLAADPAKAKTWLQQAAAQNDAPRRRWKPCRSNRPARPGSNV